MRGKQQAGSGWRFRILLFLCLVFGAAAIAPACAQADDSAALWHALKRGGNVILIRHAATDPGFGDPPGFTLDDCRTQRNLSAAGREDARRLGEIFRRHRIPLGAILSSRWCRCQDTAQLAFGRLTVWEPLNNIFDFPGNEPDQTPLVKKRIAAQKPGAPNVVMVSHGVNIAAIARISPATAEMVIVRPSGKGGGMTLVGRIPLAATDD